MSIARWRVCIANESMVLLKNDGTLPSQKGIDSKSRLVGPLADQTKYLLGSYNGVPTHTVSVLEGLQGGVSRCPDQLCPGNAISAATMATLVPASAFNTSEGQPGLTSRVCYWSRSSVASRPYSPPVE